MLRIEDYDYGLADERIAKYPLEKRDASKLLLYKDGKVSEDRFWAIDEYLPSDALLVYNNTKVIQARLVFHKDTGARIEVFCLEPIVPHDYVLSFAQTQTCTWKCMVGNLKKWKQGELNIEVEREGAKCTLRAERLTTTGNTHEIRFTWDNEALCWADILDALGELPIPPYLNRATEESDKRTYQTVYSRIKGSVAAPTAGLHFTDAVFEKLRTKGIHWEEVTLHVGAGTFQPVKTEDANEHTMHTETIAVQATAIANTQRYLGKIIAVGTTSVRTLESLYFIGCNLANRKASGMSDEECMQVKQFDPYETEHTLTVHEALQAILDYLAETGQEVLHAATQIMIKPGYTFRIVEMMITNFHQPRSTLLLLVSAFVGGDWEQIYDYALENDFRFLSYGDSSLLVKA